MDKRKLSQITMVFVVLTVLVVTLMLIGNRHRTSRITLPEETPSPGQTVEDSEENGAVSVVKIAPDTVQSAIRTLKRPEKYHQSITVKYFWNGGSKSTRVDAAVQGAWSRTDQTLPGGQTRHTLTDGRTTYLWYNGEQSYLSLPAGNISADDEQMIPTYEDILNLPTEEIAVADYQEISGCRCIYVKTAENKNGYVTQYWVNVETGLLVSAERMQHEETIYRMDAQMLDTVSPELFRLPDGASLPKK